MLYSKTQRFTRKPLKQITAFSKVARYQVNTKKSVAFLYTAISNPKMKLHK
jgi:hypothetical protein